MFLNTPVVTLNKFTSPGFLKTIQQHKVTQLYIVPPIIVQLIKNPLVNDLSLERPDVSDCAVIGIPNDKVGEVPKAYVALNVAALAQIQKGETSTLKIAASIMKLVADNKINYKHVKTIEFLDAIPKTASGKLLRNDLRVLHAASEKAKAKL